jgi:hypothetical protein
MIATPNRLLLGSFRPIFWLTSLPVWQVTLRYFEYLCRLRLHGISKQHQIDVWWASQPIFVPKKAPLNVGES